MIRKATSLFRKAAEDSFGSFETWKVDFTGVGKMRGVGWAICYLNPQNGLLTNHWITLHETGMLPASCPFSSWMPGNTRSFLTINRRNVVVTLMPS